MESLITLHIEKLPEGFYLATSDDIQGLVVQAETLTETLSIASDVAKQLMQAQQEHKENYQLLPIENAFDYALVVNY